MHEASVAHVTPDKYQVAGKSQALFPRWYILYFLDMPMSQSRTDNFIYSPFLQERVENGKKRKNHFPLPFFYHPERKPCWARSDSAAGWEQDLHPRCLFYESAERLFASRTVISIGHLCIKEPCSWGAGRKNRHCLR